MLFVLKFLVVFEGFSLVCWWVRHTFTCGLRNQIRKPDSVPVIHIGATLFWSYYLGMRCQFQALVPSIKQMEGIS